MCPGCGGEEYFPSLVLIWAEERDEFYFAFVFCLEEEEVLEIDEPILSLPQKEQGGLLTIYGGNVFEEYHMLKRSMYFSVF